MNNTIVEQIKSMSVMDLVNLNNELKEAFGITDAMLCGPANVAVAAASTSGGEAVAEKTAFDLLLKGAGEQKVAVIKVVRELTGLGLKEAKDMVDGSASAPAVIKSGISKDEAEKMKAQLEAAGATCEIK